MSLLQQLLDILSEETQVTPALLARRLNVSQGLVELMLADLERLGHLKTLTGGCQSCAGCSTQPACQPCRPRLWVKKVNNH